MYVTILRNVIVKNKSLLDIFKAVVFVVTAILIGTTLGSKLAHAQTVVAVLDTGLPAVLRAPLCDTGHKDFTNTGLKDTHGHATNLDSILARSQNKDFCVVYIKIYDGHGIWTKRGHLKALRYLRDVIKPNYVLLAQSGASQISEELSIFKQLLNKGTKFSVAAGNDGANLGFHCNAFPACYRLDSKNYRVVGWNSRSSNYGGPVKYDVFYSGKVGSPPASGTSQASAIYLRKWLDGETSE